MSLCCQADTSALNPFTIPHVSQYRCASALFSITFPPHSPHSASFWYLGAESLDPPLSLSKLAKRVSIRSFPAFPLVIAVYSCWLIIRPEPYGGVCWWCVHKAPKYVGCPISLDVSPDRTDRKMSCIGYFCSFQCSLAWAIDNNRTNVLSLTYLLARRNYHQFVNVPPAPPRELLQIFGGPLNIKQFRATATLPRKRQKVAYKTLFTKRDGRTKKI